jgi:site-specific DNA recombinase
MSRQVALYARVSSKQQKEDATIESQLTAIREYAKAKGYEISAHLEFKDNGYSGDVLERPALDELRDLIRQGAIDHVLIFSPDRLSRKYVFQLLLKEEWQRFNVKVEFIKYPSAETPEEKMALHFQGIFAEYERTQIMERSRRGRLHKAKQGDASCLSSLAYGYRRSKKEGQTLIEIIEEQALIVKEIFRLYTQEGISLQAIAKHLTDKGIRPPKRGKEWSKGTLKTILSNQAYIGTAYFGQTEKYEGALDRIARYSSGRFLQPKNPRRKKPQENWIPISMPPLISEVDFELAQERFRVNQERSLRNTKEVSLLQGLLVCQECGKSYYKKLRSSANKKIGYYCCRSQLIKGDRKCSNPSIRQDALDVLIFQEVMELLKNPQLIEQEIERRIQEGPESGLEDRLHKIKKELAKIAQARDKILDAYQDGEAITLEELKVRMNKLSKQQSALEQEASKIEAEHMQQEKAVYLKESLQSVLNRLEASSQSLDIKAKQRILRLIVDEIVIGTNSIKIKHCIPIRASSNSLLCQVGAG